MFKNQQDNINQAVLKTFMYLKQLIYFVPLLVFCGCQPMGSKDNLAYPSSNPGRQNLLNQAGPMELPVKGEIPPWLHGTLLRIGPSWFGNNPPKASLHWFDGLSMLHAFEINDNKIFYYNKFLNTDAFQRARVEDVFAFQGFAANPYDNLLQNLFFMLFADETPNANVNIYRVAGKYLALTELPPPVEFHRETLDTVGGFSYADDLPKVNVFESAHPQYDIEEHCFYNYIATFFPKTSYLVYRIPENSSARQLLAEIKVDSPSYMHSFSLTKNYIILTEYPFKLAENLVFSGKPFIKNYAWDKNALTKIIVINKKNPCNTRIYFVEPFFSFHHINAYEEDENIILNIVAFNDSKIVDQVGFFPDNLNATSFLMNLRIDLKENKTQAHKVVLGKVDLPRINSAHNGRSYRYFYAVQFDPESHKIIKWDTYRNKKLTWSEKRCFAGEPVFIQNPFGDGREDDGIILSLVLDVNKGTSFLLILNAKNFKELTRAYLPHGVPFGLHGQFYR